MRDTKPTDAIKEPSTLEIYVRKYGITGSLGLLQNKVWDTKTPAQYKEFFKKCLNLLTFTSDHPKLRAADAAYRRELQ